jgi:hypothetical protein
MSELVIKGYEYLMSDCYNRIKSGKPFDVNFKPYTKEFTTKVLKYFEEKEEYEKCKTLVDFINIKFNHELGYTI